jgi:acetate kinase
MSSGSSTRVLVVNSGSSSLKYRLIDLEGEGVLASGLIERIGESRVSAADDDRGLPPIDAHHTRSPRSSSAASVTAKAKSAASSSESRVWRASMGGDSELPAADDPRNTVESAGGSPEPTSDTDPRDTVPDHTAAFEVMLRDLEVQGVLDEPLAAVGHRVVHGGERFVEPTLVTPEVELAIDELAVLAPLHNPPNLAGIRAATATFPGVPQVAVFDTGFHRALPPAARTYASDAELAERDGIPRFGVHGTSFEYVSREAARMLGRPAAETNLIMLHLGNGASACAVRGGVSVETSMGLTPLEGLVMGTRGGDLDPGAIVHLLREGALTVDELDDLLNHGSGLLGLGGHNDIRDVRRAAEAGEERAALAIEVYCHRIRSYVGAYLAQLGRADAIVFTAGVGENNASVRAEALAGLEGLGIRIDPRRNASGSRSARTISAEDSAVAVLVIPTNEELEIARQTLAVVGG